MTKKSYFVGISVMLMVALTFGATLISCGDDDGGGEDDLNLSGSIVISTTSGGTAAASAATGATLYAVYSGNETVTYQWNKDGAASGGTGISYTPAAAGSYTVTVSASGYQSKTSAPITVTGSSSSGGNGTPIEIPATGAQVYVYQGSSPTTPYTGGGTVKIAHYDDEGEWSPIYDIGTVANGKLQSLILPAAVDQQYLESLSDEIPDGITVSPEDVKAFEIQGFLLVDGANTYNLAYLKETTTSDDAIVYLYASKAATITGTYTEKHDNETETSTFNLTLKQGWNPVYAHISRSTNVWSETLTTDGSGIPSDLQWMVFPWD
jgi:hypothetical protein